MAELLWPDVSHQMGGLVRVAVNMTIEARHARTRALGAAVFGRIELLLRKSRKQEPQPLQLFGIENPVEEFIVVGQVHELSLGDITQVRPCCEIDGWWELRQEVVGNVKVEIEPGKVPAFQFLDFVKRGLWEHHSTLGMIGMRQWHEAVRKQVLISDFFRGHSRQLSHVTPLGSFTRTPSCTGLPRLIVTPAAGR